MFKNGNEEALGVALGTGKIFLILWLLNLLTGGQGYLFNEPLTLNIGSTSIIIKNIPSWVGFLIVPGFFFWITFIFEQKTVTGNFEDNWMAVFMVIGFVGAGILVVLFFYTTAFDGDHLAIGDMAIKLVLWLLAWSSTVGSLMTYPTMIKTWWNQSKNNPE